MESVGQSITKTQQTSITMPSFMFIVIKCQVLQIGVRNMELGKDLKQVLEDFSTLSSCYKSTTDQIDALKKGEGAGRGARRYSFSKEREPGEAEDYGHH